MTYLDSAVLNFTERMCRRFQTWTGRTNVWLAFQLTNLSIVVYFIWVANLYWLSGDAVVRDVRRAVLRRRVLRADADDLQDADRSV